jgi:hypothetical protein
MLEVITVQSGPRYPDLYVERLRNMVARHLAHPHRFVVWADRRPDGTPRRYSSGIEVRDLSDWKLPGYFNKLRLFDPEISGAAPFLFLDLTMVIRGPLSPLITWGEEQGVSLVGVRDWNYPILNSSVLWVRPDIHTASVWDHWARGVPMGRPMAGDQNFIDAVLSPLGDRVLRYWPEGWIVSYKKLRKQAARDPEGAQAALRAATILKFHGRPKPPEVLAPWRALAHTVLRHPTRPRLWRYLAHEIEAHWR